jgi:hypothetical protein
MILPWVKKDAANAPVDALRKERRENIVGSGAAAIEYPGLALAKSRRTFRAVHPT